MKLSILSIDEFSSLTKPLNLYIPEEEATEAFWSSLKKGLNTLRRHLSRLGAEGSAWELPGHHQRCRVLYAYVYADSLYCPALLSGIAAAIPQEGKPWCVQLECYTDKTSDSNELLGWAAIIGDTFYTRGDNKDFIAHVSKLGFEIA